MEDKTPMYIVAIVCIVAVVAIVSMLTGPAIGSNSGITGNVVSTESAPISIGDIGRFLLGATLIGAFIYMYTKWE